MKIWTKSNRNKTKKKFISEVRKNAHIDHYRVAKFYDAQIIENICFCRMEYIEGDTLRAHLRIDNSLETRYALLQKILFIMDDIYQVGLFHGDLHGDNVIVSNENLDPYIIDFGTSVFNSKTESNKRDATKLYELCCEVFPEIKELDFINPKLIEQGSHEVQKILIKAVELMYSLKNKQQPI